MVSIYDPSTQLHTTPFFPRESLPPGVNVMNLINHSRTHKPSAPQNANARRHFCAAAFTSTMSGHPTPTAGTELLTQSLRIL